MCVCDAFVEIGRAERKAMFTEYHQLLDGQFVDYLFKRIRNVE